MEGNLIKRLLKIKTKSYSEPLYYTLGITTLVTSIEKRRLSFLKQLISNSLTKEIVKDDIFLCLLIDNLVAKGSSHDIFEQSDSNEVRIKKTCNWENARLAKIDKRAK